MQLGHLEVGVPHPVGAEDVAAVGRWRRVGLAGRSNPRPTGRVELLDDRLHVARGLFGRDVAGHGRHGLDIEPLVEERHGDGHCVVDAGVDIENYLPCHEACP
jgi:hypothetical protein